MKTLISLFKTETYNDADTRLRGISESQWATFTEEEKLVITKYTETYSYLNERLRNLIYSGGRTREEFERDVVVLTNALSKCRTTEDMVIRRGTNDFTIRELNKNLSEVKKGDEFTDGAFLSTAVHREKGFFEDLNLVIFIPKNAMGFYAEPASHYNDSCQGYFYDGNFILNTKEIRIWNGNDKQTIGSEMEWIGQRGSRFKVIKKIGNSIFIKLIGQLYTQP